MMFGPGDDEASDPSALPTIWHADSPQAIPMMPAWAPVDMLNKWPKALGKSVVGSIVPHMADLTNDIQGLCEAADWLVHRWIRRGGGHRAQRRPRNPRTLGTKSS